MVALQSQWQQGYFAPRLPLAIMAFAHKSMEPAAAQVNSPFIQRQVHWHHQVTDKVVLQPLIMAWQNVCLTHIYFVEQARTI